MSDKRQIELLCILAKGWCAPCQVMWQTRLELTKIESK